MTRSADYIAKYFMTGQILLFATALVCMVILPEAIYTNDGISYYGVHRQTIVPYTIGILLSVWCFAQVIKHSKSILTREVRFFSAASIVFLFGLAVTPHTINTFFWVAHVSMGILLFFSQFVASTWATIIYRPDVTGLTFVAGLAITMLYTAFYLSASSGFLIFGQLLFQLLFAISWWRAVKSVLR